MALETATFRGFSLSSAASDREFAGERDERLVSGRGVAPARVIEAEPSELRRPVLEHANEASRFDVATHVGLHEEAESDSVEDRDPRKAGLVERDGTRHVDQRRLPPL